MKEFRKPISNDGSEAFRQCVMDFCLKSKEMPIQVSKENVESLIENKSTNVIFERGRSLAEMTNRLSVNNERFSECILKMVYLKYNPNNRPTIEEIQDRNGLIELFNNTENPICGLAADDSVEIKMEMMIAYCPKETAVRP